MWYTPQHGFSCALGVLAVPIALAAGVRARPMAILLAGCLLGASLAFNPLLGAAFCVVYGVHRSSRTHSRRARRSRAVLRHAIAVVPVVLALALVYVERGRRRRGRRRCTSGSGASRATRTLLTFLLQFGPHPDPDGRRILADSGPRSLATLWPAIAGVDARDSDHASRDADRGSVLGRLQRRQSVLRDGAGAGRLWLRAAATPGFDRLAVGRSLRRRADRTADDGRSTRTTRRTSTNRHLWRDAERARGANVPFDPATEYRWTLIITPERMGGARVDSIEHAPQRGRAGRTGRARSRDLEPHSDVCRAAHGHAATRCRCCARPAYAERNQTASKASTPGADPRLAWQQARRWASTTCMSTTPSARRIRR